MRFSWVNTALLFLLITQLGTGFLGLIGGAQDDRWRLWLHGIGAYAILLLAIWKSMVIYDSLRRYRRTSIARLAFLGLAALVLVVIASGFYWVFIGPLFVSGFSLMTIHVVLALAVLVILGFHVQRMRFVFRDPNATGRRALFRLVGSALGGLILWQGAVRALAALALPGARRRFTGSYETDSSSGQFPIVSWLFDNLPPVELSSWRLVIDGAVERPLVFTYEELTRIANERQVVTLDCTGGWYSSQTWEGVSLGRLLNLAGPKSSAKSLSVQSVTGYGRRFGLPLEKEYLLAMRIGDIQLDHGHGYPIRLVAPDRRGFEWVKWISRITVNETSEHLQPPVPLQ